MTTASTPCRSRSACHSGTTSPTRPQASSASRSSQVPGKVTTPNFTSRVEDLVVLDQGVREELLAHLGQALRVLDVELHQPADVHVRDAEEAERRQRALDGLSLRVQDPGLRPDEDP